MGEETMSMKKFIYIALVLVLIPACGNKKTGLLNSSIVPFSYTSVLEKSFEEYYRQDGKVVPVTIEQAIEVDGSFTNDGLFLVYASDKDRGNFDIYLRDLTDITTYRVTSHPSRDTAPAISPNGKYLTFVSRREDPEGDIYIVDVKPAKLLAEEKKKHGDTQSLDAASSNLSQVINPTSRAVEVIRDDSPVWSSDNKWIAFSSTRDSDVDNIWIMNYKGKKKRQLTTKGGRYPRFSKDGTKIVYVSYRDREKSGEIYTIDLADNKETRITNDEAIKLNPTFTGKNTEIVYTCIDSDSNRDGVINLEDTSVLLLKEINGDSYPLTLRDNSSFSPRWYPVFASAKYKSDGIISYSSQIGNNINLNIIPEFGVIPKRSSAMAQYRELTKKYFDDGDRERYMLSLERVYTFFRSNSDIESTIYIGKALNDLAEIYISTGKNSQARECISRLDKSSKNKYDYRKITAQKLSEELNGNNPRKYLEQTISEISKNNVKETSVLLPYLLEDLGDSYLEIKNITQAYDIYSSIIKNYPKYARLVFVYDHRGDIKNTELQDKISEDYINVLQDVNSDIREQGSLTNKSFSDQRNPKNTFNKIMTLFEQEKNLQRRMKVASSEMESYRKKLNSTNAKESTVAKRIVGLTYYINGLSWYEQKNYDRAKIELAEALNLINASELIYYKVNVLLGKIAEQQKDLRASEEYYGLAANNYLVNWKQPDIETISKKLIDYYEEYGSRAEQNGNYDEAVALYTKYVRLVTYLHLIHRFEDIYNEYAARAHILYIDAVLASNNKTDENLKNLEAQYMKRLNVARMDYDKAHIYGLGYIYTRIALNDISKKSEQNLALGEKIALEGVMTSFSNAIAQLNWALFIDDSFSDPYLLKGWIYQYVDNDRQVDAISNNGKMKKVYDKFFSRHLWENSLAIYARALEANDEKINPEKEGNLLINTANTYFLLNNFPRALAYYQEVVKYSPRFNTKTEEAIFHFHTGYCYWQTGNIVEARNEFKKVLMIYDSLASGKYQKRYKDQFFIVYRYYALFERMDKNYKEAINWYNRIIEFAGANGIKIDQARYMQEIAYCYKELGDTNQSISYLDRAEQLLAKYPNDDKKYQIKWTFFGFLSFSFYDLGVDTTVIGNNKIYGELSKVNKQLLNVSYYEDIYFDRGNYSKAIEYLQKKNDLLKKRESSYEKEAKIKVLNNIGYCYYRLRDYTKAREYFQKAWDYSADEEVNNQNGIFAAIINLSNLYAYILETDVSAMVQPVAEVEQLQGKILAYRNSYEKNNIDARKESLEADKKKSKDKNNQKVTTEELEKIKSEVAVDAAKVYYAVDIANAVLDFYKLELNKNSMDDSVASGKITPDSAYKNALSLVDSYQKIEKVFSDAVPTAEIHSSKRLAIKLQLNVATCRERRMAVNEAYATLSSARTLAEKYQYNDLLWEIDHRIGKLLSGYGRELENEDYLRLTEESFKNALAIVEAEPFKYAEFYNGVNALYTDYANFLIKSQQAKSAMRILDRKSQFNKIAEVYSIYPVFADETDRNIYNNYQDISLRISELEDYISSLIEKGAKPEDNLMKEALQNKQNYSNKLMQIQKDYSVKNSDVISYLTIRDYQINAPVGSEIYYLYNSSNGLYGFKISNSSTDIVKLGDIGKDNNTKIASFIDSSPSDKISKYLIINDESIGFIKNEVKCKSAFMFAPSIISVNEYQVPGKKSFSRLLYTGNGLKASYISSSGLVIDENPAGNNLADYTAAITGNGSNVDATRLFSQKIESALLAISTVNFDSAKIILICEAALYSGVDTIVIYRSAPAELVSLTGKIDKGEFSSVNISADCGKIIASGKPKLDRLSNQSVNNQNEFNYYHKFAQEGDYLNAEMHLNRWGANLLPETLEEKNYLFEKAYIAFKGNDISRSEGILKNIMVAPSSDSKIKERALSLLLYMAIADGDFVRYQGYVKLYLADTLLAGKSDYLLYNEIMASALNNAPLKFNEIKKENRILSFALLQKLAISYQNMFSANELKSWSVVNEFDGKDLRTPLQIALFINSTTPLNDARSLSICKLKSLVDPSDIRKQVDLLMQSDKGYDSLSIYAVEEGFNSLLNINKPDQGELLINSIFWDDLLKKSEWKDLVPFVNELADYYFNTSSPEKGIALLDSVLSLQQIKNVRCVENKLLLKKSALLIQEKKYNESLAITSKLNDQLAYDTKLQTRSRIMTLESMIFSGKLLEADLLIKSLSELSVEDDYVVTLLRAQIYRQRLIGMYRNDKGMEEALKNQSQAAGKNLIDSYEAIIFEALKKLENSEELSSKVVRKDLLDESLDFLILYRMRGDDYLNALAFSEIKKQISLRNAFANIVNAKDVPAEKVKEFSAITNRETGGMRFSELINAYPVLQVKALINTLPADIVQSKMPYNSIILYVTRNQGDIFIWIISRDYIEPLVIRNAYSNVANLSSEYKNLCLQQKSVSAVSKGLAELFKPVANFISNAETLYIVTDSDMEKVPFEIIGEKTMLEENVNILYLTSLMSALRKYPDTTDKIVFAGNNNQRIVDQLEEVALRESGLKYTNDNPANGNLAMIQKIYNYNQLSKELYVDNVKYNLAANKACYEYYTSGDFMEKLGYNDFIIANSFGGNKGVIINDVYVHDLNNAEFLLQISSELRNGKSIYEAFFAAKTKLRTNNNYRHPAYWAGIRFYNNGF